MLRNTIERFLLTSLIVVVAATGAFEASAQQKTWNQEQVATLARDLATAVREVRNATRAQPGGGDRMQMNSQAMAQYLQTLQQLDRATGQLARQLEAGEGHDQTLGTARRIDMLLRDARTQSRRLDIPEPTRKRIEPALALIEQITPYYRAAPEETDAAKSGETDAGKESSEGEASE
jgi:hypothetical protein